MKRYKRFLSLFFLSILVSMTLIGCGTADADVTATAETVEEATEAAAEETVDTKAQAEENTN